MNYDITFCARECENMKCERNQKHIKSSGRIVSMAIFSECDKYINTTETSHFEEEEE